MNCNEKFIVDFIGKMTLEFDEITFEDQNKIREILYNCLSNKEIIEKENKLLVSDIEEKIIFYLQVKKLDGLSEKTLNNYKYILDDFSNFIIKPINAITTNDIRIFLSNKSKTYKNTSLNTVISTLKSFFSFCMDEDLITKNPMNKISLTKVPKRLRQSLTVEELEILRNSCRDKRERALIEFIFATGCRLSEISKVNINDLNMNENTCRIIGKGNKERIVCFNDKTKLYIKDYINSRNDDNPSLFVSVRKPYGRLSNRGIEIIIQNISKRTGINKSIFPHLLRHTMATLALQSGTDITIIQSLLGHENPSTTQIYAEQNFENIKCEYRSHFIH